ncbi:MAG: hypothetical protein LBH59_03625 [Planctomycetaceae bacterium]|jgi:hypothetical protein|nr:hypothetical protein [Planctomycetaceae bacterium]
MNCIKKSGNANRIVNSNVANDCNSKIKSTKISIESCQRLLCNLAGTLKLTFEFLLTCVSTLLGQQIIKYASCTRKLVRHYYMLYQLRKRGGIFGVKILRILPILSVRKYESVVKLIAIKSVVLIFCVISFVAVLSDGNLIAAERFWFDNFDEAMNVARVSEQNLLIYFSASDDDNFTPTSNSGSKQTQVRGQSGSLSYVCKNFEQNVFETEEVTDIMSKFVLLKLSVNSKVMQDDGEEVSILELPMFKEMVRHPGLAIVDFENYDESYYGEVVGVLPFINFNAPNQFQTITFLTIPAGKLTQRTLTYAVKIHPDRPLSANGEVEQTLLTEATGHAAYQAKNRVLGHHNFSARSGRVRAVLGEGIAEVCAQSGMYNGHFEAALACVRGWRNSPAHWKHVRAKQKYYAYDMVQSANGLWYATGLFVSQ